MRCEKTLWFFVVVLLVFALFATADRPMPSPTPYAPYAPQPQHGILGNIAGWVVDFIVGRRMVRAAGAEDYQVRACQIENLDPPSKEDGEIAHERGW